MDTPHELPDPQDAPPRPSAGPGPDTSGSDTPRSDTPRSDTQGPSHTPAAAHHPATPDAAAAAESTPEELLVGFRSTEATVDAATRARIRARVRAATGDALFDPVDAAPTSTPTPTATAASSGAEATAVADTGPGPRATDAPLQLVGGRDAPADRAAADPGADRTGLVDPDPGSAARDRSARRSGRRWLTVLEVAAALLVVAMVAAATLRSGDDQVASGPGAISRDDLIVAAKGTAEQRLTGDAQLYRRVVEAEQRRIDGAPVMVLRTTESWVSADGAGREEASAESVLDESGFDSSAARSRTEASLAPKARVMADAGELDLASFSYVQVRGLPSDGPALLREVQARVRSSDPGGEAAASMLAALLSLEVTPPTVRAAAVDALFQLGGTTVGTVRAPDGRTGEGIVGGDVDGGQWIVVLDARNAKAIAFVSGVTGDVAEADLTRAPSWTSYGASSIELP